MKRFEYARLDTYGIDAFSNDGRREEAISEFASRLQGKEVCEKSVVDALMGLKLWNYGYNDTEIHNYVTKVNVLHSFVRVGRMEVELINDSFPESKYPNICTHLKVLWRPEDIYDDGEDEEKEDLLERVKKLETQVKKLTEKLKRHDSLLGY